MSSERIVLQACPTFDILTSFRNDILEVKTLYRDRKHKRCAIRCEELYKCAEHPIQKAFLMFYQAICYEVMGITAHRYSSNKLSFLEFSQDSYQLALSKLAEAARIDGTLPTSYYHQITPLYNTGNLFADLDRSQQFSSQIPSTYTTTRPRYTDTIVDKVDSRKVLGMSCAIAEPVASNADLLSKTPKKPRDNIANDDQLTSVHRTKTTPSKTSRSLRALDQDNAKMNEFGNVNHLQTFNPEGNCQPSPSDRALPPLPFNHKPKFEKRGKRVRLTIEQAPRTPNKSKWVKQIPVDYVTTPITPRFKYIARTLAPHKSNYQSDQSQVHLSHGYNAALRSFEGCIGYHIDTVAARISQAREVQEEHQFNQQTRSVSFWSFEAVKTSSSLLPRQAALQERIAKLRTIGWAVTKEQHGWKGQDYYDKLRTEAEVDLSRHIG